MRSFFYFIITLNYFTIFTTLFYIFISELIEHESPFEKRFTTIKEFRTVISKSQKDELSGSFDNIYRDFIRGFSKLNTSNAEATADIKATQILEFLLSRKVIKNTKNKINPKFLEKYKIYIVNCITQNKPIRINFPGLSPKHNFPSYENPDGAEALSFIRMKCISDLVSKIHPKGIEFLVLPDGILAAGIFLDFDKIRLYEDNCRKLAIALDCPMQIIDYQDFCEQLLPNYKKQVEEVKNNQILEADSRLFGIFLKRFSQEIPLNFSKNQLEINITKFIAELAAGSFVRKELYNFPEVHPDFGMRFEVTTRSERPNYQFFPSSNVVQPERGGLVLETKNKNIVPTLVNYHSIDDLPSIPHLQKDLKPVYLDGPSCGINQDLPLFFVKK